VNAEQAEIVKLVGATEVIHPEQSAARKAALLIHHPRTADYLELSHCSVGAGWGREQAADWWRSIGTGAQPDQVVAPRPEIDAKLGLGRT
jgi:hypothetical protein